MEKLKVLKRLLVFFIGIPLVLLIVFFDWQYHLTMNIVLVFCAVISSIELHDIFSTKGKIFPKPLICTLSALLPLVSYIFIILGKDINYSNWAFLIACMILLSTEIFAKSFENSIYKITSGVFTLFYCGFLLTFITRMTLLSNATIFISLFLLTVFINDSLAWLFGVLFGRNNNNVFASSPNKSIAGFIGGILGAVAICILAQVVFPDILLGAYYKGAILGFLCAIGAIIGDLIESVLKRSSGIKDSGIIIPGRGGMLDSIDSILFTAPIYYIAIHFLFNPTVENLLK